MDIIIEEMRIRNYKCYESVDVKFKKSSLILGANNSGKTSLLEALKLCFTRYSKVDEELIFVRKNEELTKDKKIIIDVLISSVHEEFNDEWFDLFGALIIEDQFDDKQCVALRTVIKYNSRKGEYDLERKSLNVWPTSNEVLDFEDFNSNSVTSEVVESIPVFYLDAKRDILAEMGDKYSYWNKLVKDVNLSDDNLNILEKSLNEINDNIIENSDVLKHLSTKLNSINDVLDTGSNSVEINPVTRKIKDLNRGMEIRINDKDSESFLINNQGMGTKSWATFLTLSAYIDWKSREMNENEKPFHPLLLLEEPEAHLHPQAQRKIYKQMESLQGQKFISTHSPIIATQPNLEDFIHVYKRRDSSSLNYINLDDLNQSEKRKLKEEVLKSRGDILFADTIILCEGETEEQALPKFFTEFFDHETFELGTNIVSVNGYGNYKPFIRIAHDLDIDLFILSDGESKVIKKVKNDYKDVFKSSTDEELLDHIKFLPNESDFEKYLIDQDYKEELLRIIDNIKGKESFIESYIEKNNGKKSKPKSTKKKCESCQQSIYKAEIKDYSGEIGFKQALLDCLNDCKTEYSAKIGEEILKRKGTDRIPQIIQELFKSIANKKGYSIKEEFKYKN
ncbi:ATP-dependent nuclease [Bacillus altitudinis]|uniref:ATP-dependent nuclease n=1 Tax=Bacillus altitudinis TaxID=293387 RepID=UPI002E1DC5EE|nr:AAA family ATPase [Bacillus altitudinis]